MQKLVVTVGSLSLRYDRIIGVERKLKHNSATAYVLEIAVLSRLVITSVIESPLKKILRNTGFFSASCGLDGRSSGCMFLDTNRNEYP